MKINNLFKFIIVVSLIFISGCVKPPIQEDTVKPVVNIITPQNGTEVYGNVIINIEATDNVGIKKVKLYIVDNSTPLAISDSPNLIYTWDTTQFSNGIYTITARAEDNVGNIGEKSINVTVNNQEEIPQPIFKDSFEGTTNNEKNYHSEYYKEDISSTNEIEFVDEGKIGKAVRLKFLNSYIAYKTNYINPSEGTLKFYFKPDSDMLDIYTSSDLINDWYEGFLIDCSGWLSAFNGAFFVHLVFNNEPKESYIGAGVYGWGWSYIDNYLVVLSSDKFYEIAFVWNSSEGKIKLYIDGQKIGEDYYKAPNNSGEIFFIGQNPFSNYWPYGPHAMKGTYDELEIYNVDIYEN
ncbi:MAG: Ig-like domain-containing protein [Dictyoglomaceae bacterium]|nr:Ig-like domain-containing protein [Dictyoglomaceae bacterium]